MSAITKDVHEKIMRKVERRKREIIEFARELVKTRSVNPYTPEISFKINEPIEREVAKLIREKLRELGLRARFVSALPNRPNVVCSLKRKGRPALILNGHMDTVDVGNEKAWKYPPFSARIVDKKLYGRGSLDMKSSLAAMVFTLATIAELESQLDGNLIATFVVDEEPGACSEIGTKYLLEQGLSGDACIVCEPGEKICIGTKGGYRIKLITRGEAVSTGAGAWERREKGINAVTKMARVLLELEKLKLSYRPTKLFKGRKPVITPGTIIRGGSGINVVPDYCGATIDIRLLPGQTKKEVKSALLSCIRKLKQKDPELKVELIDLMFVPSVHISKEEKIVKILEKNARLVLGKRPEIGVSGSWCDSHFFISKGIPTISGFGTRGENFHGANEFVYVRSIIEATKIYALTAFDFLTKSSS